MRVSTSFLSNSIVRRTATAAVGAALILGMATPAFADSGTPAPKPATAQSAPAAPAAPAAAPSTKLVAPAASELMPHGKPYHQSYVRLTPSQKANAAAIVKAAQEMKLPARAAVIAVATALQESKLYNLHNLGRHNDHDSLGLFQQRPSAGWGTPAQTENPDHAAKAFMSRLVHVHNWKSMPLTRAAQAVQVSAFGDRYAQWEAQAAGLVAQNFKTPAAK
jgi:pyruvate/2-oxoglutarate dehydrogenase complex dihydrolipoamide acyltransferase (E2) component